MIKHRSKIFYILCGIVCVAFVLSYAITNMAVGLLLLLFFIDKKKSLKDKFKIIKQDKIIWLYVGFFVAQLIGMLYTENNNEGLRRIEVLLPISFLPAIIIAEKKNEIYFSKLLSFIQFTIPIIFIVLILIHLLYVERTISTFVHFAINEGLGISQFYLIFALIIPLFVSYQKIKKGYNKILNGFMLAISLVLILVMGNKLTIIILFLLSLGLFVKHLKSLKKSAFVLASIIALTLVSYNLPIVKERFGILLKTTDFDMETIITKNNFTVTKNTLEHRVLINYLSFDNIIGAFPFGVGTGDVQDILNKEYKAVNFKAAILAEYNSHNQYFSEFLKTGVLGGFLFIALLYALNKRAFSSKDLALAITGFFTIACFIESYLTRQHGVVIFAFLIPLFLTHGKKI